MSKTLRVLLALFVAAAAVPATLWLHYAFLRDDPRFTLDAAEITEVTLLCLALPVLAAGAFGLSALYRHLRTSVIVITVTERATPLVTRFLEQDARLERRERIRAQLHDVNVEIETFNASLTPNEREAWSKRPGPYGK